ncbi:MAG: beta-phosphoglucomutase family hydrolase [Jatrophihabitans sp.]|uniref:beta-phosphoglucomutase family hydrolase n=1 Tax=Jatrophihabitans sp. TaxID=1932789 RepID=UPI003F7E63F4
MLGLPDGITTCLFDLDGVLTDTASVHRQAWKQTFDPELAKRGQPEFTEDDYNDFVDGKPRADGVRDFFASRHIELSDEEVQAIGDRKNEFVLHLIDTQGVRVFPGSERYVVAAATADVHRVVVSSSANTAAVLKATGLDRWVEDRIDGVVAKQRGLKGKPAPDTFLAGAELVGVPPQQAVVFEDATAGVAAGRAGGFGYVVGVNRLDDAHGQALKEHGADIVVTDLAQLL